jgi:hypothetical protein
MIERKSAEFVNEIVNHPSIHPWISGPIEGPLDLTGLIEDGSYIPLMGEFGGFMFWRLSGGVYDAHSAVLPEGRGKWTKEAAIEALHWMFEKEGAKEIMMAAPKGNLAVLILIRSLKAKFRGRIENGWHLKGQYVPSEIYSLTKADFEKCLSQYH